MFNRFKHIRSKIALGILVCSILTVVILTAISSRIVSGSITQGAEERLLWMSRYYAQSFSEDFHAIESNVIQLEAFIKETLDINALRRDRDAYLHQYEETIAAYFKDFADKRTDAVAAWVYFSPTWSDQPHDVYFVDGDGDKLAERQEHIPLEYYSTPPTPTDDKEWWFGPKRTGAGFWTNPYEWTLINGEVIKVASYARPLYIDGEFVGVVGTYFRFTKLATTIRNIRVYGSGYATLFNEKLDAVIHPRLTAGTRFNSDNLETVRNGRYKTLAEAIKAQPFGVVSYEVDGENHLFAFSKLSNGWVMGINPDVTEVYAALYDLLYKTGAAMALCLLLSAVVAAAVSRSITQPLLSVIDAAKQLGAGDFSVSTHVRTNDEVSILAQSLNAMTRTMRIMTRKLTNSYERMRSVVEGAGMFTWDYDVPSDTFTHNAQWCRAVEYPGPVEEGVKPLDWIRERLHPDDLHYVEMLRGKIPKGSFVNFESRMLMPSGEWRWFRCMGRVEECDDNGNVQRVAGTGFDIHASKVAEISVADRHAELEALVARRTQELVESRNQAEAASEAKTRFLSTVSHEIRTPMNAIVGFTHIFDRTNLTPEQREYLAKIKLSAGALLNVINDVLDISKIESGKLELERTPFHMEALIDTVISIVGFTAREKGLTLNVEVAIEARKVYEGDPKRLSQIMLNLLNNAVKFTAAGSITLRVGAFPAENSLTRLEVSVTDTGIGLTEEQIPRLFQPFSQADSSVTRKYGGTGLGLAICRQLLELMGGTIGVRAVADHGACFYFSLLLTESQGGSSIELLPQRLPNDTPLDEFAALHAHCLLVEDNAINQEIAKTILETFGMTVDVADNGSVAVDMCKKDRYEIIFMDMQMPVMDGLEATRVLRELGHGPDSSLHWLATTPIVAMTANAMSEDRDRCLEAGMDDHIGKPIDPATLRRGLAGWLSKTKGTTLKQTTEQDR